MYFAPFLAECREIALKETFYISIQEDSESEIPEGDYFFEEFFCSDLECDCRIVHFLVNDQNDKRQAHLTWGWEDRSFYDKSFPFPNHNFPGPSFAEMEPQSFYAISLLEALENKLLADPSYRDRIKKHYALFKESRENKAALALIPKSPPVGRNEPCSCGSSKKAKKCCFA